MAVRPPDISSIFKAEGKGRGYFFDLSSLLENKIFSFFLFFLLSSYGLFICGFLRQGLTKTRRRFLFTSHSLELCAMATFSCNWGWEDEY
jgi:hypothetical protein